MVVLPPPSSVSPPSPCLLPPACSLGGYHLSSFSQALCSHRHCHQDSQWILPLCSPHARHIPTTAALQVGLSHLASSSLPLFKLMSVDGVAVCPHTVLQFCQSCDDLQ